MSDAAVIELLINNGLHGANSRQALRQLEMQRNDPNFVAALAGTFGAVEPQIELPAIAHQYPWPVIRQVAGWVLKTVVQQGISEEAMGSAAGASISVLQEESDDRRLISAAAVVIARLTMIGGVEWWAANNLDLSGLLLNDMLVSNSPNRVTAALLCLQYLVEDAPNHLGPAAGSIIDSVGDVAINHGDARVRGIALGVLAAVYEFGFELDWRVENLSPLQEGLAHGSVRTAGAISTALSQFTTLEHEVAAKVFRTAAYLVEYLSYLESSPETSNGLLTMFAVWSQAVYDATTPNMTAPEVATEALSFASAAYNTWEKTGGLDSIAALCDALSGNLEVLLDNILHHMIMKDEEEFEMLETDGYAHRDRHVRRRPGKKAKRSGDEGKADGDDGDELCPEASVRNAACLAIEFMAFVEPQRVAAHVVMRAHEMLAVQDWHQPECAICALGSIFAGCQNELIASLPTLIPMIGAAVGDGQPDQGNHVATMSICIFTLMKFSSWTIAHRQDLFDNTVVCVLPCLTSLSKRVQHAAVTFVRKVLEDALLLDPQGGGPLRNHLPDLMGTLYTCLPVYHTNNLHQLCTTVSLLIPIMGGAENVASSIEPFEAEFAKRLPLLQQTMHTRYMDGNLQQSVDCDAFELGYVVAMAYAAMSMGGDVTNQAMNAISTWVEVLKFALQCECGDDDAGIFQSPVNLISQLMNLADQSTFGSFISQNNLEFVQMMIYIATTVPDAPTRSAVLATFYNLLECYGLEVIPSVDELIGAMIKFPTAAEDTGIAADCALLTSKLIELANPPTDHLMRYVAVLASQVRGDTVDNASMILLAESVGCVMQMYPAHFTLAQASQVALALCRGHNNPYKAASTQGIAAIIEGYAQADSSSLEELDWTLTAFVKLICSWHSDARHHEGLTDTIGSLLSNASQHPALSLTLQREIYDRLPATMIQLMATAYGLPT